MIIRRATPADVPGMLALRTPLRLSEEAGTSTRGGFLLGSDAQGYLDRIAGGHTWVLQDEGGVQGLAVGLPDPVMRASDIWARRDQVDWRGIDVHRLSQGRIAYVDQLAVRPGGVRRRAWAAALGLTLLLDLLTARHDRFAATTVVQPVLNLAAVPWLKRVGARAVGRIDEVYPEVGALVSEIWLLEATDLLDRLTRPRGLAERWVIEAAREAA